MLTSYPCNRIPPVTSPPSLPRPSPSTPYYITSSLITYCGPCTYPYDMFARRWLTPTARGKPVEVQRAQVHRFLEVDFPINFFQMHPLRYPLALDPNTAISSQSPLWPLWIQEGDMIWDASFHDVDPDTVLILEVESTTIVLSTWPLCLPMIFVYGRSHLLCAHTIIMRSGVCHIRYLSRTAPH
jgi:hypothetical protein